LANISLFLLLALVAEILGTVGGFGSSLFFIPIASYFFDFHTVLGITGLFHVLSNITKIAFFRKGVDKKIVLSIGIPAVIAVIIGALLSKYIDPKILELLLAVFLITVSIFFLYNNKFTIKPSLTNSVSGGFFSGIIAGLLGTGGAIRGITLAAYNLKIDTFIATSACIDLAIDSSRSVVYAYNGYVHRHDMYLIPLLLIVSIIGTYIGKKILVKISEEQFKSLVLILVLITGLISLVKVFSN
jgi:hypothetical protein